ncbi:hypothetical protein [Pseudonocardia sp. NPDC049154]
MRRHLVCTGVVGPRLLSTADRVLADLAADRITGAAVLLPG